MEKYILYRTHQIDRATLGKITDSDNKILCYTLEDLQRDKKIQNETAIPTGLYVVEKTYSSRFKRVLPLIYNMQDKTVFNNGLSFSGIRIHNGNYHTHTEGCILVGSSHSGAMVTNSKNTLNELLEILPDLFYLEIINLIK